MIAAFALLVAGRGAEAGFARRRSKRGRTPRLFRTQGVVKGLAADRRAVVIAHELIPNYMDAMTMPFKVKEPGQLVGLQPGDRILPPPGHSHRKLG